MLLLTDSIPRAQPLFQNYVDKIDGAHLHHSRRRYMAKSDTTQTEVPSTVPVISGATTPLNVAPPPGPTETLVSRKRPASSGHPSPNLSRLASAGLDPLRRSASPKQSKRPRVTPQPMTAAAALADDDEERRAERNRSTGIEEQTSPNPAKQALGALMGINSTGDANGFTPATGPTAMSDALKTVAQSIQTSSADAAADALSQTSPVSLSSFGTVGSSTAPTALPVNSGVESPGSMDEAVHSAVAHLRESAGDVSPEDGNKAFSYPGPPLPPYLAADQRRGVSLPHSVSRQAGSRSPTAKKHRCAYCSTEFTRHHNLKSHLLTHSQEKPYVCQTCQSRFRRLHDLKRHTKLHTGERPHICPKCGRRFARGDALARHNKGPGGCAGRRASVGSYGGDDDDFAEGNEDSMDGLVYTEPGQMDDEDQAETRPGMPSIRRVDAPNEPQAQQTSGLSRQPSTYPPIQGRPTGGMTGGLFPPPTSHGGSSASTSPMSQPGTLPFPQAGSGSTAHGAPPPHGTAVFPAGGITESPQPLSPGAGGPPQSLADSSIYRNRSPSLTAQFQQRQYSRVTGRRTPPPNVGSLPPPSGMAPQLPPPHQLNPPDPRYTLHSQGPAHPPTAPTGPPTHMSGGGLSSQSNSLSSHGPSHHGSGEGTSTLYPQSQRDDRLWAYVKSLEDRVNGLQDEVTSLKAQLSMAGQPKTR